MNNHLLENKDNTHTHIHKHYYYYVLASIDTQMSIWYALIKCNDSIESHSEFGLITIKTVFYRIL